VVAQSSSAKESTYNFKRIPECYFDKLSDHIDNSIVYAGIEYDPTAKAIDWLMNDCTFHTQRVKQRSVFLLLIQNTMVLILRLIWLVWQATHFPR
jgi:hypothetical protein